MSERNEDAAYAALQLARRELRENWPEPATSRLYYALRAGARNILASVTGRVDDTLAFEVATRVILDLGKFHGKSKFSTWFYRYVTNAALLRIRKAKARREIPLDELAELAERQPIEFTSLDFLRLLSKLDLNTDEVTLVHMMLEGHTQKEISKVLGSTEEGVRMRWRRLRQKLNSLLTS